MLCPQTVLNILLSLSFSTLGFVWCQWEQISLIWSSQLHSSGGVFHKPNSPVPLSLYHSANHNEDYFKLWILKRYIAGNMCTRFPKTIGIKSDPLIPWIYFTIHCPILLCPWTWKESLTKFPRKRATNQTLD